MFATVVIIFKGQILVFVDSNFGIYIWVCVRCFVLVASVLIEKVLSYYFNIITVSRALTRFLRDTQS